MWDLPRPGLEPVSPSLADGFLTSVPPGKPLSSSFIWELTEAIAEGTVSQIAQRNCSEEVGEASMCVILAKGCVHASAYLDRRLLLVTRNRYPS